MKLPIEVTHMADDVMEARVSPSDKVEVHIVQGYKGPYAGDASGGVYISVNGRQVLRLRGTFEEVTAKW
jgi:hypothetical protein